MSNINNNILSKKLYKKYLCDSIYTELEGLYGKRKLSKKALTEAYEILKLLDDESLEKIPEKLLNAIDANRYKTYVADIIKLVEGDVVQETKDILCAVYCEYLATDEEKKVIDEYAESAKTETANEDEQAKVEITLELLKSKVKEKNL